MPLKIAAKVDRVDQAYCDEFIHPMVKAHPNVEFIGEIDEHEKAAFLGDAAALLFPIDWPEPFGLVMIEAMACGTPVIALRRGSVPEIVEEGVTGFIVDTVEQATAAVRRIPSLDRAKVRNAFERRFTAERMTRDYVAIYRGLATMHSKPVRARTANGRRNVLPPVQVVPAELSVVANAARNGLQRAVKLPLNRGPMHVTSLGRRYAAYAAAMVSKGPSSLATTARSSSRSSEARLPP